jgi:hypothetical protein
MGELILPRRCLGRDQSGDIKRRLVWIVKGQERALLLSKGETLVRIHGGTRLIERCPEARESALVMGCRWSSKAPLMVIHRPNDDWRGAETLTSEMG